MKIRVWLKKFVLGLTAVLMGAAGVQAAPGDLDTSFGTGGVVETLFFQFGLSSDTAYSSSPLGLFVADGNGFAMSFSKPTPINGAFRFNFDGSLNPAFNGQGYIATSFPDNTVDAQYIFPMADGGYFDLYGKHKADGSPDLSFGSAGGYPGGYPNDSHGIIRRPYALDPVAPSKLYSDAGTSCTGFGCAITAVSITRWDASTGALDTAFGNVGDTGVNLVQSGQTQNIASYKVIPRLDGSTLVVMSIGGGVRIVALDQGGRPVGSFGASGVLDLPQYVAQVLAGLDGSLYALEVSLDTTSGAPSRSRLVKYKPDGRLDTAWATAGSFAIEPTTTTQPINVTLSLSPDERVELIASQFYTDRAPEQSLIVLDSTGAPDTAAGMPGWIALGGLRGLYLSQGIRTGGDPLMIDDTGRLLIYGQRVPASSGKDGPAYAELIRLSMFDLSTTPASFAPQSATGVAAGTTVSSTPFTVSGLSAGVRLPAQVSEGRVSVNGGPANTAALLKNGDRFTLSATASLIQSDTRRVALTTGGIANTPSNYSLLLGLTQTARFDVSTASAPPDVTLDAFPLAGAGNVAPGTEIISAAVTPAGYNTPAPIGVSGGQYSLDGGLFTAAAGTISPGQSLRLKLTAPAAGQSASAVVTIGGTSSTFTATSAPAPALSLSADPTTVVLGFQTTITWTVAGATACTAANDLPGDGSWFGPKDASDGTHSATFTVGFGGPGQQTYSLTCSNTAGSTSRSVVITKLAPGTTTGGTSGGTSGGGSTTGTSGGGTTGGSSSGGATSGASSSGTSGGATTGSTDNSSGGGGAAGWPELALLSAAALIRRRRARDARSSEAC